MFPNVIFTDNFIVRLTFMWVYLNINCFIFNSFLTKIFCKINFITLESKPRLKLVFLWERKIHHPSIKSKCHFVQRRKIIRNKRIHTCPSDIFTKSTNPQYAQRNGFSYADLVHMCTYPRVENLFIRPNFLQNYIYVNHIWDHVTDVTGVTGSIF